MNVLLAALRRISLGGIVVLILSITLKGFIPQGYFGYFLVASPLLYLIFMFFTWLSAKSSTERISHQLGVDIPNNNYITTLIRGLALDIISPIGVIIDLFKDRSTKVAMFIVTYITIITFVFIWFFVL